MTGVPATAGREPVCVHDGVASVERDKKTDTEIVQTHLGRRANGAPAVGPARYVGVLAQDNEQGTHEAAAADQH